MPDIVAKMAASYSDLAICARQAYRIVEGRAVKAAQRRTAKSKRTAAGRRRARVRRDALVVQRLEAAGYTRFDPLPRRGCHAGRVRRVAGSLGVSVATARRAWAEDVAAAAARRAGVLAGMAARAAAGSSDSLWKLCICDTRPRVALCSYPLRS